MTWDSSGTGSALITSYQGYAIGHVYDFSSGRIALLDVDPEDNGQALDGGKAIVHSASSSNSTTMSNALLDGAYANEAGLQNADINYVRGMK